ncbi:aerotaxis receptor [Paraburkholderia lycopersici]|uniref:Aerotaxis receptor n=1 Tax=Paraburkholderia lycopersici TaxID=416944 RepID=A0A1G6HEJ9_9BURK|nr:aerotaxis receptor [Paraburkholderia lycopersici]
MRNNLPVTGREYELPKDTTLMSVTDCNGLITYANAAFVRVSGFEREELIGQPHNVVRHPDMPPEAFADMWATLRAGLSWAALVKNRRKNGDHYWVRAHVAPIDHRGTLLGYMSVRTWVGRDEVEAADELYRRFRSGKATHLGFHRGTVVRSGWMRWASSLKTMRVRWRIRCGALIAAALGILGNDAFGLRGVSLAAVSGIEVAILLLLVAWIDMQISHPVERVLRQALDIATGKRNEDLHMDRVDEIGMILRAIEQSGLNLRSLVDDIGEQIPGLGSTSREMAQGSIDLGSRSEETAASLEHTAASIEQITAAVRNNAQTAGRANELAVAASAAAAHGCEMMDKVTATMDGITVSSRRISEIVDVIDGIAFQTNILALNAAVEAARAGESGRGFAVVAGEVRALAQRSANAAKEVTALIGQSVATIEGGNRLIDEASTAMTGIVDSITSVTSLIGDISSATREQSDGIGEVNSEVIRLEQMTQQNATLVEQSAEVSGRLQHQAARLIEAVTVFQ